MATQPKKQSFEEFCREAFNPKKEFSKPEVLKGYRVLSCTQYILGPSCASYLAELGAEVIPLEAPRRGEAMRQRARGVQRVAMPTTVLGMAMLTCRSSRTTTSRSEFRLSSA